MTPTLNWREIALLVDLIRPELADTFVDRIVVPERPRFATGYLKGEWAMRMGSRRSEKTLIFSIRARRPYIALIDGKGPKASTQGTRSPFDLATGKILKGARLREIRALERERTVMFEFDADGERVALILTLIPALPEALLVRLPKDRSAPWPVIARSRTKSQDAPVAAYIPPDGAQAPMDLAVRDGLFNGPKGPDLKVWLGQVERGLEKEAWALRLTASERSIRDSIKQARERERVSSVSAKEARAEADWQRYGDLLKGSLAEPPALIKETGPKGVIHVRQLYDFEQEKYFPVPCDPKLDASAQAEKFYSMARRKARRLQEAEMRGGTFRETAERLEKLLAAQPAELDWSALEKLERAAGRSLAAPSTGPATQVEKRAGAWLGKSFVSSAGDVILAGRARDENLELTFKHARGNDLWLHVRGKPGAHIVIPLNPGKSAPLETLLDAANLCIHYSGGGKWGKTEVDYTFKKYVKRIKDSTEASYTNNKTLYVDPDPARLKRLLSQE